MTKLNTLWIGDELGPVHTACLRSMLRNGHEVVLHSFGRPKDLPRGIELFDATKLMKETEIIRHKETNNLALASDRYRYRILREGLGVYVDCDVYFLKPFVMKEYNFGWQTDSEINCAVLGAPHDSALVKRLLDAANDPYFIPPWLSEKKQRKWRLRKWLGRPKHVSEQPWGTIGPILLTHLVKELGLSAAAEDTDIFYPLSWDQLNLLYATGLKPEDLATPRTIGIHLYNSAIRMEKIQKNTPLYEIIHS